MTKVVHCKKEKYDIYIGRPSIFGNPFEIGAHGTREQVIEEYKIWFYSKINRDALFKKEILNLKDKILGCWCKPKVCHGDIIANYLDYEN